MSDSIQHLCCATKSLAYLLLAEDAKPARWLAVNPFSPALLFVLFCVLMLCCIVMCVVLCFDAAAAFTNNVTLLPRFSLSQINSDMSNAPPPTPSATFAGFCEDGTSKKAAIFQTVSFAVEGDPHAVLLANFTVPF